MAVPTDGMLATVTGKGVFHIPESAASTKAPTNEQVELDAPTILLRGVTNSAKQRLVLAAAGCGRI